MKAYTVQDPEPVKARVCTWLRAVGVDPGDVYRVEVRRTKALIFEYDSDEDGNRYVVPADGRPRDVARKDPYKVPITHPELLP